MDQRSYRSASNSLLVGQRIELKRRSRSKAITVDQHTHSVNQALSLYSFSGRPSRHMELSTTFKCIFSPNRNIEKIPAPLRSYISSGKSPNLSPRSGNQTWLLLVIPTYSCKTLFPTIRLTLLGSDFPCL
ncbi:hypothetical protein AVEN_208466-1 [Araneus ventricosus]|uniref:Uncharacterized protein n=1 Tax=Araneus ventricosus TaxID=182803 RepID=A0A4Y2P6U9_ARAVE|nr:hypothetical protein AVEN_208466-1 [Araneus ventricosus]